MEQEYIPATEAIQRMRLISKVEDAYFTLVHLTYNHKTGAGGETRKVERCRLRPSLPDGVTRIDPDHYLTYVDGSMDEPRMCFKKLIRYVGFPPDYKLLKVNWFEDGNI
ncbi:MAG: hypothetical protein LBP56_05180 [Odoribacteraceae bacterium]|jgi:hypothetical protein|nr:hypothetical protein [Odoribacteraceae bacterium]